MWALATLYNFEPVKELHKVSGMTLLGTSAGRLWRTAWEGPTGIQEIRTVGKPCQAQCMMGESYLNIYPSSSFHHDSR